MLKEVINGNKASEVIDFVMIECCSCSLPFFMPTYMQKRLRNNSEEYFYCPNGHPQHYTGKTEAQKLQEQLTELKRQNENALQLLQNRWLDEMNQKNKLKKELKRLHNGVCPCCNRSFTNLLEHLKNEHPEHIGKVKVKRTYIKKPTTNA